MIREALAHLPGIGRETLKALRNAGVRSWPDIINHPDRVPVRPLAYESILNEVFRCEQAVADGDIAYLVRTFEPQDHWRILGHWFDRAAFFDIETEGMENGSPVTVISLFRGGKLDTFMRGENLDAFLDRLDDVELLVSFNGSSFDVPRITRHFNIPSIPCPHVDLRWLCYHEGREGGLKSIETALGVERPADLRGVDGKDAELLWKLWTIRGDRAARERLLRYCAADALALQFVAVCLLRERGCPVDAPAADARWALLETAVPPPPVAAASHETTRLQARWNRMKAMRAKHGAG